MKVVINKCFGGFNLSPLAIKEIAALKGRECYFFEVTGYGRDLSYKSLSLEEVEKAFCPFAFSVPNPQDYYNLDLPSEESSEAWRKIHLDSRPNDRSDKDMVAVVEKLGDKANGSCAKLVVIEIPDGVDYTIEDYDGQEHVAEVHQTWG